MDTSDPDGHTATMEVDGETAAMDTYDEDSFQGQEGQESWGRELESSDMISEDKAMSSQLTEVPKPFNVEMNQHGLFSGVQEQQWRLPEGLSKKKVLQKGQGLHAPQQGSCCSVTLQIAHSVELDMSQVGYPLGHSNLQIGEGGTPISCLIDVALMSMKMGEIAEVYISELRNVSCEFVFQISLHDFTKGTPTWSLTPVEKCSSAATLKEKGAQLFKDGNIFAAFVQFRAAIKLLLSILPCCLPEDEAANQSRQQLLYQCYLNLAACQMKTANYPHVVTNCTQALSIDSSSVKALYRRASAYIGLGNYLKAEEDLKLGLTKEPSNRALLDLMHTVNAKLSHSQAQMAQGLSKMFA